MQLFRSTTPSSPEASSTEEVVMNLRTFHNTDPMEQVENVVPANPLPYTGDFVHIARRISLSLQTADMIPNTSRHASMEVNNINLNDGGGGSLSAGELLGDKYAEHFKNRVPSIDALNVADRELNKLHGGMETSIDLEHFMAHTPTEPELFACTQRPPPREVVLRDMRVEEALEGSAREKEERVKAQVGSPSHRAAAMLATLDTTYVSAPAHEDQVRRHVKVSKPLDSSSDESEEEDADDDGGEDGGRYEDI